MNKQQKRVLKDIKKNKKYENCDICDKTISLYKEEHMECNDCEFLLCGECVYDQEDASEIDLWSRQVCLLCLCNRYNDFVKQSK